MKKLWVAALLNLVPLPIPLGYRYLDRRGRFWVFTVVRCVAVLVGLPMGFVVAMGCSWGGPSCEGWVPLAALVGPLALVLAINAVDAALICPVYGNTSRKKLRKRRHN